MNLKFVKNNYLRLFLPIVLNYLVASVCTIRDNSPKTRYSPPGWVFGVVWPVLYLLIGYSWSLSSKMRNSDQLFVINIILLLSWLVSYGCYNRKDVAFVIIILLVIFSIVTIIYTWKKGGVYLVPYVLWLMFATFLSTEKLNK
jgi:benzodiazapine receptor